MDVFSRTFLPASSEAGLPIPAVSRHMPVLRRCVACEETTLLVARALRPGTPVTAAFLLLLTSRSLVISRESRLLHRVQLHLAAGLRDLTHVAWTPHERAGIELAVTASDGIRERLWLPIREVRRLRQVDALLSHAFRSRTVTPAALPVAPPLAGVSAA
jgi:hypothetical protein